MVETQPRLARLKRAGVIMMLGIAGCIALVATVALIIWDVDELREYWYYFLAGGFLLYGIPCILVITGIRHWNGNPRKANGELEKKKVKAYFTSMLVLLAITTGGAGWLAYEEFVPDPFNLHPRQEAIVVDSGYTFSTIHGNLNQTTDWYLQAMWDAGNSSDPRSYAWGESYIQRGLMHMYLATGNRTILDKAHARMEDVLSNSDLNGDGIPGYGTDKYHTEWMEDHDLSWIEFLVWDGVILLPIVEMAQVINGNAMLSSNASLNAFATIAISTGEQVIQKWNATHWFEEGDRGYYVSPPYNDTAIFNRIHALGRLMIILHECTGNQTYYTMVQKIARFFKEHLVVRNYTIDGEIKEMYTWGYSETGDNSDTSHGSIDVDFAVMCHERGIVFTSIDMERFANTFVDFVYRGPIEKTWELECNGGGDCTNHSNVYADNVNGYTGGSQHYRTLRQGWFQLYRYYANTTVSSHIVFTSIEDLIEGGLYSTGTLFQALSFIREMAWIAGEFPVPWY